MVAKEVAGSKKRVRRPEQTETVGGPNKAPRAAGRASGKPKPKPNKKAAAKEVTPTTPEILAVLQPVAESVGAAEAATTANDESAMTVLEAPAGARSPPSRRRWW